MENKVFNPYLFVVKTMFRYSRRVAAEAYRASAELWAKRLLLWLVSPIRVESFGLRLVESGPSMKRQCFD